MDVDSGSSKATAIEIAQVLIAQSLVAAVICCLQFPPPHQTYFSWLNMLYIRCMHKINEKKPVNKGIL